jgi:hypothetical protein
MMVLYIFNFNFLDWRREDTRLRSMVLRISCIAVNFVNTILICYRCSHIFEFCHI